MRRQATIRSSRRSGFTLVEMLVSVALILLIMTLFAEAFSIAAGSIKKQRGLAENDQRARSMVTIVLGDLQKRTFRQRQDAITQPVDLPDDVPLGSAKHIIKLLEDQANRQSLGIVPLHPDYFIGGATTTGGDATGTGVEGTGAARREVDSDREKGYLYISEGDPTDDADDQLRFTIDVAQTDLGGLDTTRLTGRAVQLAPTWDNTATPGTPTHVDQPIWDDGKGWVDTPTGRRSYALFEPGTTASRVAEIAYFIRNGKLYRRVNLIREPLNHVDGANVGEGQPESSSPPEDEVAPGLGGTLILPDPYPRAFWNDFDHGATRAENAGSPPFHLSEGASLDNTIAGANTGGYPAAQQRFWSLGDPRNRFGHDNTDWVTGGLQGRPKEYMNPTNIDTYIGMYTHEETSHPRFGYPGQATYQGAANPTDSPFRWGSLTPVAASSDLNGDSRIDLLDEFNDGPRDGEELLLSNCHAFEIKVWDDVLASFVDMGHGLTSSAGFRGDHHLGHLTDTANLLDASTDFPGKFQAARHAMGRYGGFSATADGNRVFDTWHPAFNFTNNEKDAMGTTVVRPDDDPPPARPLWTDRDEFDTAAGLPLPAGGGTLNFPQIWNADTDYAANDCVVPRPNTLTGSGAVMPPHMSFYYIISESEDPGVDGLTSHPTDQPNWPESPGATIEERNATTGDVIRWKAIPNTIGLKAMQITLRFFDPTSGQLRQMTITHSFVEL